MRAIKASAIIETNIDGVGICKAIEEAGRTCYKSEGKITGDSYIKFIEKILKIGHHSVLEHESIRVRFICDRGVTHEIVRHRLASYSQESTRYCNYSKEKFGNEITVIKPCFWSEDSIKYHLWEEGMSNAEKFYFDLITNHGAQPQEARSVLPNSLKTEIVMSCNIREWRHFFALRTSIKAHPQMREVAIPLFDMFKQKIPVLFDDIEVTEEARNWGV